MITPEEKDAFLIFLTSKPDRGFLSIDHTDFGPDISEHLFSSLLDQFENRGLIEIHTRTEESSKTYISVGIESDDFLLRGGYKFEEDIFRNTFTKLELELAKLEKQNPTINFENATKLVGAVASGFDIYKHLNL